MLLRGPLANYEEFYVTGLTSKIFPLFQSPAVLYSLVPC